MKNAMFLKIWELLAPYLAEWLDGLIRKWLGNWGGKA